MKLVSLALLALPLLAPVQESRRTVDATPRPALEQYDLGKGGLALGGYDPVAYFTAGGGRPTKGAKQREVVFRGVRYRFASDANRDLFLAAPARYEPAYGGWCAFAMASGDKTEANPKSYLIEQGRLLVFYDGFFGNTRKQWLEQGGAVLGPKATAGWQAFSSEAAPRALMHFRHEQGLALGGFDPVSVVAGEALEGQLSRATVHDGVTYGFASEANRETFLATPARFEPAYGGWCAFAMASGRKVAPELSFSIVEEGQLLLFASGAARDAWRSDPAGVRPKADAAWLALHS